MSLAINQGLFKLNIIDHHAVLGVSIDADSKQIRLRYLKIAQKLHPDKCRSDQAKMKMSGQILSKLVNPAYEQLSRKNISAEHQLVLTQIGNRLAENKDKVSVKSELAQELLKAGDSVELIYPKLLKKITTEQYNSLDKTKEEIESISELNLVYLMLKGDRLVNRQIETTPEQNKNKVSKETSPSKANKAHPPATTSSSSVSTDEPTPVSRVDAFVERGQQYIAKGEFDRAIKELKDALRIDPNHGIAHAVMGQAYIQKKQLTMAKVHIGKAFQADPHNQLVIESKKALDKLTRVANNSKTSNPGVAGKTSGKNNKPANNSFFGSFFGTKKK